MNNEPVKSRANHASDGASSTNPMPSKASTFHHPDLALAPARTRTQDTTVAERLMAAETVARGRRQEAERPSRHADFDPAAPSFNFNSVFDDLF